MRDNVLKGKIFLASLSTGMGGLLALKLFFSSYGIESALPIYAFLFTAAPILSKQLLDFSIHHISFNFLEDTGDALCQHLLEQSSQSMRERDLIVAKTTPSFVSPEKPLLTDPLAQFSTKSWVASTRPSTQEKEEKLDNPEKQAEKQ